MSSTTEDREDDQEELVSKSQLKRDNQHLLEIGDTIIKLKDDELKTLDLPDELDNAVSTARKIKSNSGLKRQRLYIGKLLRNLDHQLIEVQVNKIKHRHDTNTAAFNRLESWRNRLIDNDKTALAEIIERFEDVDRQHIHQLTRGARQELTIKKPPVSSRKLFRYLQQLEDAL